MAKKKEQRLAAGVLWMLAAGVLGCPLTASAAEEAQTSKTEPLWQESMGSGAQEETVNIIRRQVFRVYV